MVLQDKWYKVTGHVQIVEKKSLNYLFNHQETDQYIAKNVGQKRDLKEDQTSKTELQDKWYKEIGLVQNVEKKSQNYLLNQKVIAQYYAKIAGEQKDQQDSNRS